MINIENDMIQMEKEEKLLELKRREHIEYDWMAGDMEGRATPTDARASPFREEHNGIMCRVAGALYSKGGGSIPRKAVPVDPKKREAHILWKAKNLITGEL